MHSACPSSLLARPSSKGSLEFQHSATNFVAESGVVFLVVNDCSLAAETTHEGWFCASSCGARRVRRVVGAGTAAGCAGSGTERHCCLS